MPRKPHDDSDRWDAADIRWLRSLTRKGMTQQAIAVVMGRTVNAVRSKLYRLRHAA